MIEVYLIQSIFRYNSFGRIKEIHFAIGVVFNEKSLNIIQRYYFRRGSP